MITDGTVIDSNKITYKYQKVSGNPSVFPVRAALKLLDTFDVCKHDTVTGTRGVEAFLKKTAIAYT